MTEDVKFIRGNDRISQLAQRPDLAEGVARVRRDMEEADRTHAMGLAALRQAAELTQVELARRMGVTQAAVSRMEQPHDLLLSTLNAYLEAVGGNATVDRPVRRRARSSAGPLPAHRIKRMHRRVGSEGIRLIGLFTQVKVLLRTVSVAVRGSGREMSCGHGHMADSVAAADASSRHLRR